MNQEDFPYKLLENEYNLVGNFRLDIIEYNLSEKLHLKIHLSIVSIDLYLRIIVYENFIKKEEYFYQLVLLIIGRFQKYL